MPIHGHMRLLFLIGALVTIPLPVAHADFAEDMKERMAAEIDVQDPEARRRWAEDILEKAEAEDASPALLSMAGFAYHMAKPKGKPAVACGYWRRAAEKDFAIAMHFVGECYARGWLTHNAKEELAYWYGKAVEAGHWTSLCALGELRMQGRILEKDVPQGIAECRTAAENGAMEAQLTMGDLFSNGTFLEPDYEIAARWYRLAFMQESPKAGYMLATLHFAGDYPQESQLLAAQYAEYAAIAGFSRAPELTARLIWTELTSDEVRFAERLYGELGWRHYYWLRRAAEGQHGSPQIVDFYRDFQTKLPADLHEAWKKLFQEGRGAVEVGGPLLTDLE